MVEKVADRRTDEAAPPPGREDHRVGGASARILALQRTAGNRAVTHALARQTGHTPAARAAIQRSGHTEEPGWMETASKFWGGVKESAYSWMIEKLRGAQRAGLGKLRGLVQDLPPLQKAAAELVIGQVEVLTDLLISLLLAVVGLAVGLVSGVAKLLWGLLTFLVGIMETLILFIAGFFGQKYRDDFDEKMRGVARAIENIVPALRTLKDRWVADWNAASPDRKTLMIGELTGEIEALLVSIWAGGQTASAVPTVTVRLPAFAVLGPGGGGVAVTVAAGGPTAAAGLTGAMASTIDESAKGGGKETKEAPKEPVKETKPAAAAEVKQPTLKPDANSTRFKSHFIDHRDMLEKVIGRKFQKWADGHGVDFIEELERLKASGDLKYVGKGTLGKGQPWAYIYRGRGLTLAQRQSGEFWTLLESGKGKDLAIQMTELAAGAP
jgi:hypothetical protein